MESAVKNNTRVDQNAVQLLPVTMISNEYILIYENRRTLLMFLIYRNKTSLSVNRFTGTH